MTGTGKENDLYQAVCFTEYDALRSRPGCSKSEYDNVISSGKIAILWIKCSPTNTFYPLDKFFSLFEQLGPERLVTFQFVTLGGSLHPRFCTKCQNFSLFSFLFFTGLFFLKYSFSSSLVSQRLSVSASSRFLFSKCILNLPPSED